MSFPERLKEARILLGYRQKQVAEAMGIETSTYCGYETGKRQPDVAKIKQLASILGVSGDFLLETGFSENDQTESGGGLSRPEGYPIDENHIDKNQEDRASFQLVREYQQLDKEHQKVVRHLVKYLLAAQNGKSE